MLSRRRLFLVSSVALLTCFAPSLSPSFLAAQEVGADVVAKIVEALPAEAPATPAKPRHLLIFSRTAGFRHSSIPTGAKAIQMLGEKTRAFTAVHSEDPKMFDADQLQQFDAVFMLNTTGECLADDPKDSSAEAQARAKQRQENLLQFVSQGKGLIGAHSATDTMYSSKEYGDMVGGWFRNHPWHTEVPIKIEATDHPLTAMFDSSQSFVVKDEIYQFAPRGRQESYEGYQPYSRDRLRVLMSLDGEKFDVSQGEREDRDYAISWVQQYDQGRVFYSVLGHNDFIFWHPQILKHYLAGIQFAMGDLPADATPSNQLTKN